MTAKCGRIEAVHTFATNVVAAVVDNGGAPYNVTVTAGSYTLAQIVTSVQSQLADSTLTISDGEGVPSVATGLATLTADATTVAVTWTDVALRDALGFAGNLSAAASHVGTRACPGLWLPGCPAKFSRHGDADAGTLLTTYRQSVGPTGVVYTMTGSSYRVIDGLEWQGIPGQRMRPHLATYVNESLEEWLGNTQYATGTYASLFLPGASVRLIWDADVDGTYTAGKFLFPSSFDPDSMVRGWTGRYSWAAPRLIVGA